MFVIFDAYGTLLELDDFFGRIQRCCAAQGVDISPETARAAGEAEMRHYIANIRRAYDETGWHALCRECALVMAQVIESSHPGLKSTPETWLQILESAIRFRVFPEVVATLQTLRAQGMGLGVLSNWDFRLPQVLDETGLSQYFSFVLTSAATGHEKPARQIFDIGFDLALGEVPSLSGERCYYVGDHLDKDVLGARAAGLTPIWLVRDGSEPRNDYDGVTRIAKLDELPQLLEA